MNLLNKNVIVTGATGGMGKEIVFLLAKKDCNIALLAKDEKKLDALISEIPEHTGKIIYKKMNIKNKTDVENAFNYVFKEFKRIDLVITTTGVLIPNPIEEFDIEPIAKSIEVNFYGIIRCLESILPFMVKQGHGTIAITSTLPDKKGMAGWSAYLTSKSALSTLVECIRADFENYNIKIILIKPGSVRTKMIKGYIRHGSISAEKSAKTIINGIQADKKVIEFPLHQVLFQKMLDNLPAKIYDLIPVKTMKGGGYPEVKKRKF